MADRESEFWANARRALREGATPDRFNIADVIVDRHVRRGRGDRTAFRFIGADHVIRDLSYADLGSASARCAAGLRALDVRKGDRVCAITGRLPELYVAALGALKMGAVFGCLFADFGPEPVRARLAKAKAKAVLISGTLYPRRLAPIRPALPPGLPVITVGGERVDGCHAWEELLATPDEGESVATEATDLAFLHFTSGTTGEPKAALHAHEAVVAHYATAALILDLGADDIFWCTADPGWVTGISYGLSAPLAHGATSVIDTGPFEAERWYRILAEQRVSVWYTSPTALRMLMRAGKDLARRFDFARLRLIASVGEPLNPEVIRWGREVFNLTILDTWWQTETGAIMVANRPRETVTPGAMGRPMPGIEARVVRRRREGGIAFVTNPDQEGELALRCGWPSLFRGYLDEPERYAQCFADGYYLSGDLVRLDAEGRFWFVGRGDDIIKSAGHLIGPFEIESALMEFPGVAEVGVIGKPDPLIGEVVKAFVLLNDGVAPSDALRRELLAFARKRLGPALAPREIVFTADLPRTPSGKILRGLLRTRETHALTNDGTNARS